MKRRGSGILMHVTSLPSPFGIGDLGPEAHRFADFLEQAGQSYWQILPLSPTNPATGNSPYSSDSAFARNILLISPEFLVRDGYLPESEISGAPRFSEDRVDYDAAIAYKTAILNRAYDNGKDRLALDADFAVFCRDNACWLDDYALFATLRERFDFAPWSDWPTEVRDRERAAIDKGVREFASGMERTKFFQYLFFKQWLALKEYCNGKGILIIGDIPLYVDHNSATVWASPRVFKLDGARKPISVAGVPPDYFSKTGQLWGNPVFDWDALRNTRYEWWIRRIKYNFKLYDLLRLDHFRGLVAYWEVGAGETTAINGKWTPAPARDFLNTLLKYFPALPLVAEDLGIITPDVRETMRVFGLPGMRVLMFGCGWDMPANDYAPHNHVKNCLVYPGTHDNNTARGWFEREAAPDMKERLASYLGRPLSPETISLEMVRMAMMSVANTSLCTMQDVLGLGEEARMNKPGQAQGNWEWRMAPGAADRPLAEALARMTETYGRS